MQSLICWVEAFAWPRNAAKCRRLTGMIVVYERRFLTDARHGLNLSKFLEKPRYIRSSKMLYLALSEIFE